jgi:hypothetical protein
MVNQSVLKEKNPERRNSHQRRWLRCRKEFEVRVGQLNLIAPELRSCFSPSNELCRFPVYQYFRGFRTSVVV